MDDCNANNVTLSMSGFGWPVGPESTKKMLDIFYESECRFHDYQNPGSDKYPERRIEDDGSIIVAMKFRHPLIPIAGEGQPGVVIDTAGLSYVTEEETLWISQTKATNGPSVNVLSDGAVKFLRLMYSKLRPNYCWIDNLGLNSPDNKVTRPSHIKYILWANLFGPKLVEEIGRDDLLAVRAARIEALDDGGLLLFATEVFTDWIAHPPEGFVADFQKILPKTKVYRARD